MKFTLTFKQPDVLDQIDDYLDPDTREEMEKFAKKYLTYSEYIDVEFDTEKGTAVAVKN